MSARTPGDNREARLDRRTPPPPGIRRPFRFPSFERFRFDNGLRLLASRRSRLPLVRLDLLVPAGAVEDPAGKEGLATLTAGLLDEADPGETATELVERLGGTLHAGATWNTAVTNVTLLAEHLPSAVELLSRAVLAPGFPSHEVERLKRQRLANIRQRAVAPDLVADDALARVIYPMHRYGRPLHGDRESIGRLQRNDFMAFYEERYGLGGAALVAVGDLEISMVRQLAAERLGAPASAPTAPQTLPRSGSSTARTIHVIDLPAVVQVEIRIGSAAVPFRHPDFGLLELAAGVLGGTFSSRLVQALRERHGYTYGIGCRVESRLGAGPFVVSTSTAERSAAAVVESVLLEMHRMGTEPVAEGELEMAKRHLVGRLVHQLQTIEDVVNKLSLLAVHDLPSNHFERYVERIETATAGDVLEVSRRHLAAERLAIVAVGSGRTIARELERFGPVRITTVGRGEA